MIPDKVKIGYKVYDVQLVDYPVLVNGKECYGSCDYNDCVIKINKAFKKEQQEATFLHEIIHAIDDMHLNGKLEEIDTELFAKGLYIFIRDNPKILECFKAGDINE
jgi:hypothetical protein